MSVSENHKGTEKDTPSTELKGHIYMQKYKLPYQNRAVSGQPVSNDINAGLQLLLMTYANLDDCEGSSQYWGFCRPYMVFARTQPKLLKVI